jgi:hypothetical protein
VGAASYELPHNLFQFLLFFGANGPPLSEKHPYPQKSLMRALSFKCLQNHVGCFHASALEHGPKFQLMQAYTAEICCYRG